MIVPFLLATISDCRTVVADAHPPTNVRSTPNGAVVATVTNGTELAVTEDRAGWLHITAPSAGWVYFQNTTVRCGDEQVGGTGVKAIDALSDSALTNPRDAETLVRYDLTTQNAALNEESSQGVAQLMIKRPRMLIDVLDEFPEAARHRELRDTMGVGDMSMGVAAAFQKTIDAEPSHPTSKTWNAMPASEKR